MSLRPFKIGMGLLGGVMVLFVIALAAVALRGEDTRNVVERIDSSCARAQDPTLPKHVRRVAATECAKNVCFALSTVFVRGAFENLTSCPRRGVMPLNSPTASQQPGPGQGLPAAPSRPVNPVSPSVPGPAPRPSPPVPTPAPTVPPAPAPEPSRPVVDLSPVTGPVCDLTRPLITVC